MTAHLSTERGDGYALYRLTSAAGLCLSTNLLRSARTDLPVSALLSDTSDFAQRHRPGSDQPLQLNLERALTALRRSDETGITPTGPAPWTVLLGVMSTDQPGTLALGDALETLSASLRGQDLDAPLRLCIIRPPRRCPAPARTREVGFWSAATTGVQALRGDHVNLLAFLTALHTGAAPLLRWQRPDAQIRTLNHAVTAALTAALTAAGREPA